METFKHGLGKNIAMPRIGMWDPALGQKEELYAFLKSFPALFSVITQFMLTMFN